MRKDITMMIVYQNKCKSATIFINKNMFVLNDRNDLIVNATIGIDYFSCKLFNFFVVFITFSSKKNNHNIKLSCRVSWRKLTPCLIEKMYLRRKTNTGIIVRVIYVIRLIKTKFKRKESMVSIHNNCLSWVFHFEILMLPRDNIIWLYLILAQ